MEILMKMFFVLSFVPLVIAAAIAQQYATSGPGHPDPLPESSPVQIKQGTTPRSGDICIVHVTVIDTASGKENRDRVVTISGDRIAGIAAGSAVAPAGSCTVIDGTGKYLIPGLWDMHAHGSQFDGVLPLYVANGVTGIREMAGPLDANQFRRELAARHVVAPHIYLGSPLIDGDPPMWPNISIAVKNATQGRSAVDTQKKNGADFIKVYSGLNREGYDAILDESKRQGIPVEGHVPDVVTAWEASREGQRSFEHLQAVPLACSSREAELRTKVFAAQNDQQADPLFLEALRTRDDEKCRSLFALLKKNGSWQTPTLTVHHYFAWPADHHASDDARLRYFSGGPRDLLTLEGDPRLKGWTAKEYSVARELFAAYESFVGFMFANGVPMLAGSDSMNPYIFPGFSIHDELAYFVESGVTPLGALQAATLNPALFMNAKEKYGSVTPGKLADLVLLDADPLADIHNTSKIYEVFLAGEEFDRARLDRLISTARDAPSQKSY
jgi:hypothetical protein